MYSKWTEIQDFNGNAPPPSLGYRAVPVDHLMVIFGGGSSEIFVYNTLENTWSNPPITGEIPQKCRAMGMTVDKSKIYIFGGYTENNEHTNELYELDTTRWSWSILELLSVSKPRPRFGLTLNFYDGTLYLFGGVHKTQKKEIVYLNDFYTCDLKSKNCLRWRRPFTDGYRPSKRASHTGCIFINSENRSVLVIYGGMCGDARFKDVYFLDLESLTWRKIITFGSNKPQGRCHHTANVIGHRMYVVGGWKPGKTFEGTPSPYWISGRNTYCLNLNTRRWRLIPTILKKEFEGRANHCATIIDSRLYVWSGQTILSKISERRKFLTDLSYLEITTPAKVNWLKIVQPEMTSLKVKWSKLVHNCKYVLQIQKVAKFENNNVISDWCLVGYFDDNRCVIDSYCLIDPDLGDVTDVKKRQLEPDTIYNFRVAAINSMGRGVWSNVSTFGTSKADIPGPPRNIMWGRWAGGVLLKWKQPAFRPGNLQYVVFMAVREMDAQAFEFDDILFKKIYFGPEKCCRIAYDTLRLAFVDRSGEKSAIIFLLASKNDKHFGKYVKIRAKMYILRGF